MRKIWRVISVLILAALLINIPLNLSATALVDCTNRADQDFKDCMKGAAVRGLISLAIGGFVGIIAGPAGIGIGASAGFLTGATGPAYICADNYIRDTDDCYEKYPLIVM